MYKPIYSSYHKHGENLERYWQVMCSLHVFMILQIDY